MTLAKHMAKKIRKREVANTLAGISESKQRMISLALALGFTIMPLVGAASEAYAAVAATSITAADPAHSGTIVTNGNATNVYAQLKLNESIGVNRFGTFDLKLGDVANMHFNNQSNSFQVESLFNFVNNRINVDGVVNAIRGNAIGGKLFFLSTEGMSLGSSGAINAGALYVMTPTSTWMTQYGDNPLTMLDAEQIKAVNEAKIPINKDGSISILGNINAVDGITLKAATINVGTDGAAANPAYNNAQLRTGVTNFASVVNLNDSQKAAAGLTNLTATRTGSGDIVLAAENDYVVNSQTATSGYTTETAKAEVNIKGGAKLAAAGAADVTAIAKNKSSVITYTTAETGTDGKEHYFINGKEVTKADYDAKYAGSKDGSGTNPRLSWGSMVNLEAKVKVSDEGAPSNEHTTITGERVNVEALALNNYDSNANSFFSGTERVSTLAAILANGADVNYAVQGSKAEVVIDEGTVLRSTGTADEYILTSLNPDHTTSEEKYKALNVRALAGNRMTLGASAGSGKITNLIYDAVRNKKANGLSAIPGGSMVYGELNNEANVTVKGTLDSNTTANVEAKADALLKSSAAASGGGAFEAAVTVTKGSNKAHLILDEQGNVQAKKAMVIKSEAENSVNVVTKAGGGDSAALTAAVGVMNYDSSAITDIKGKAETEASLDVKANSNYTDNSFTQSNGSGSSRMNALLADGLKNSEILNGITKKVGGTLLSQSSLGTRLKEKGLQTEGSNWLTEMGKALELGITVGYLDESNKAEVNLAPSGQLKAGGAAKVNAQATYADIHVGATGTSNNYQKPDATGATKSQVLFNGDILIAETTNEANVNVAGNSHADTPNIKGTDVEITAEARVDYSRVDRLLAALKTYTNTIKHSFDNMKGNQGERYGLSEEDWNALEKYFEQAKAEADKFGDDHADNNYKNEENSYSGFFTDFSKYAQTSSLQDLVKTQKDGSFTVNYTENGQKVSRTIRFSSQEKSDGFWQDLQAGLSDVAMPFKDLATAVGGITDLAGSAAAFLDQNNYASYFSGAATASQINPAEGGDTASKAGVGISVGYTDLVNKANLNIGKNSEIEATSGNLTFKSVAKADDLALDGNLLPSGGAKGVGTGVVGLHFSNNEALTTVAEGAKLKAQGSGAEVTLAGGAEAETLHIGVNAGMSMAESVGVQGNFNLVSADSNDILFVDDETILTGSKVELTGTNETKTVAVTGGLAMGGDGSVGAAVSVFDIDRNNLVLIADNDAVGTMTKGDAELKDGDNETTRARKLLVKQTNLSDEQRAAYMGTAATQVDGSVTTDFLNSSATTGGYLTNVAADLGIAMRDDSDSPGISDKLTNFMNNKINWVSNKLGGIDHAIGKNWNGNDADYKKKPTDSKAGNPQEGKEFPKFSVNVAGSVVVNDINAATAAVLDNINVNKKDAASLKVDNKADDSSGIYGIAGGATFTWNNATMRENQQKHKGAYALAGAAAVNILQDDVTAAIRNSSIENAERIMNQATREGTVVAGAAAVQVALAESTSVKEGALVGSVNVGEVNTKALMADNLVNKTNNPADSFLTNVANTTDIQVSGGVDVQFAKSSGEGTSTLQAGINGAWTSLKNNVYANIEGGEYNLAKLLENEAQTNLTQVSAALGTGITVGSKSSTTLQLTGSMVDITNDVQANLTGSKKDSSVLTIKAPAVTNSVGDAVLTPNEHVAILNKHHVDSDGKEYIEKTQDHTLYGDDELQADRDKIVEQENKKNDEITEKQNAIAVEKDADKKRKLEAELKSLQDEYADLQKQEKDIDNKLADNHRLEERMKEGGTVQVAAALEVAASTGQDSATSGGASFALNLLKNDFLATIDNASIITSSEDGVKNTAKSNALSVGVAAGGNGSNGAFGGGGSVVIDYLSGDIKSTVRNSSITAEDLSIEARNNSMAVNVAGNIGVGKTAVGLDIVYNGLDTTTGAYLTDTAVQAPSSKDAAITVKAENENKDYAIAAGVGVSTNKLAVQGSLAINDGKNNVEALASNSQQGKKLQDVKSLTVATTDNSIMTTAAGGLSIGKGVAAGGSVAWAQLKDQHNTAGLSGYDVLTREDGTIEVTADDTAVFTTASFGAALGTSGFAFQGANATDILKKSTTASVTGGSINEINNNNGTLTVKAKADDRITAVSAVAAGNLGSAAFGIAASEVYTNETVKAQINGDKALNGSYYLKDALVQAEADQQLLTVGAGIAGSSGITGGGTVLVNMLNNDTSALVGNGQSTTVLNTTGNVGVLASGSEELRNYGGELSLSLGGMAGVGLSVAYNKISGDVLADVENSTISTGVDSTKKIKSKDSTGEEKESTGLVVAADGKHTMDNIMVTAAVAGGVDSFLAGSGTVDVNELAGSTKALVKNSDVNKGIATAGAEQNVNVLATDYTWARSLGGSAAAQIGDSGIGLGLASDNLKRNREVEAGIEGNAAVINQVNADKLLVDANVKSELNTNAFAIAVSGTAGIGAGGAGNVSVTQLSGTSKAYVKNINSTSNGFDIEAHQDNTLLLTSNSLSAAFGSIAAGALGIDVVVVKDKSKTEASIDNSTMNFFTDAAAENTLKATHNTLMTNEAATLAASAGAASASAGAIVAVSNLDEQVSTSVNKSNIGLVNAAKSFTQLADDTLNTRYVNVEAALSTGIGVACGVGVNYIDTGVLSSVRNGSVINAADGVEIRANEKREATTNSVSAGGGAIAGISAGVIVTTLDADVDMKYSDASAKTERQNSGSDEAAGLFKSDNNKAETDLTTPMKNIDDSVAGQNADNATKFNSYIKTGNANGADGENKSSYTASESFEHTKNKNQLTTSGQLQGVNVQVQGSIVTAGGDVNLAAHGTTNATQRMIQANGAGMVAGGLAVNVLRDKSVTGISVDHSSITAKNDLNLNSLTEGTIDGEVYQGAGAGTVAVNGAFAFANNNGSNTINIANESILTGNKKVDITAQDKTEVDMRAVGVSIGGVVGGGIMVSQSNNNSDVAVNVDKSQIKNALDGAGKPIEDTEVFLKAQKANKLKNTSGAGAGGTVGLNGVFVSAYDEGKSSVNLQEAGIIGGIVNAEADLNPNVYAKTIGATAGLFALGVTTARATSIGTAELNADKNTIIQAKNGIILQASVDRNDAADDDRNFVAGTDMMAFAGGAGSVSVNVAQTKLDTKAKLDSAAAYISPNVSLLANQTGATHVDLLGADGGVVTAGVNVGETTTNLTTSITATGNSNSRLDWLNIVALNDLEHYDKVNGVGVALLGLSLASYVNDWHTLTTDVNLKGNWNVNDSVSVSALNISDINSNADSTKAAIAGLSGTILENTENFNANINMEGANITSPGDQSYDALNWLEKKLNVDGSGYGGINATAGELKDTATYNAKIKLNNSHLTLTGNKGAAKLEASAEGGIKDNNELKGGGVVPVVINKSKNKLTYDNEIELNNSNITTKGVEQTVNLSTYDNSQVDFITTANIQGGAIGVGTSKTISEVNRRNKITVDKNSTIESGNTASLLAGAEEEGVVSTLNYNTKADVYNRTLLALATAPTVENTMNLDSEVLIAGKVSAMGDVNLTADEGLATVAESEREYKLIGGDTGGGGHLSSTALGESNPHQTGTPKVTVNGTVVAGLHPGLELTISGKGKIDTDGQKLDTSEIKFKKGEKDTWFDTASIKIGDIELANPYLEDYDKLTNAMAEYVEGSDQYNVLNNQREQLYNAMMIAGFAHDYVDGENTRRVIVNSIHEAALDLPSINASGGSVNIKTKKLEGGGSITANGSRGLTIKNQSNLYTKVNSLYINEIGGEVLLNNTNLSQDTKQGFNGSITANRESDMPNIKVISTGERSYAQGSDGQQHTTFDPSIGVFGEIINKSGNVTLETTGADVNVSVDSKANISARNINIRAAQGNVVQTSKSMIAVGGDPVARYQIGESFAKKLQLLYNYIIIDGNVDGKTLDSFKKGSYVEYLQFLSDNVGMFDKHADTKLSDGEKEELAKALEAAKKTDEPQGGMVAGQNIMLSGLYVNIDSLIQSGYQNYTAVLDAAAAQKVSDLDEEFRTHPAKINDDDVLSDTKYLINATSNEDNLVYNKTLGAYDLQIPIYYNPSTKTLISKTVSAGGGKIYISGRLTSTGNGRVVAANGVADVTIDTSAVDRNLVVNGIISRERDGFIQLTDTMKGDKSKSASNALITEYKNGQWREYERTDDASKVEWQSGSPDSYAPADAVINWTGGVTGSSKVEAWKYTKSFVAWGLISWTSTDDFLSKADVQSGKSQTSSKIVDSGNKEGLASGTGVQTVTHEAYGGLSGFGVSGSQKETGEEKKSEVAVDKHYDHWYEAAVGYGHADYTWTITKKVNTETLSSIKAGEKISIGLLGSGSDTISITGAKDVTLQGDFANARTDGQTKVNATDGAIKGDNGTLNTNNLLATATSGLSVRAAGIAATPNQEEAPTTTANIYTAKGDAVYKQTLGNVLFDDASLARNGHVNGTGAGNLTVTAEGNIRTQGEFTNEGSLMLKGNRIDLESGSDIEARLDPAVQVLSSDTMSASVNAKARNDIKLETPGTMRIGSIESEKGDVTLSSGGDFVNAVGGVKLSDADAKLKQWQEMGLYNSKDAPSEKIEAAKAAKAERLQNLEDQALAMEKYQITNAVRQADPKKKMDEAMLQKIAKDAKTTLEMMKAEAKRLYMDKSYQQGISAYVKAANALSTASEDNVHTHQEELEKLKAEHIDAQLEAYFRTHKKADGTAYSAEEQSFIYSYAQLERNGEDATKTYGWSKNDLLYALSSMVLNSEPGETIETSAEPNIKGHIVTLTNKGDAGGVGVLAEAKTVSYYNITDEDFLKQLAHAKAGDLTWDDDKALLTVRQQIPLTIQVTKDAEGNNGTINMNTTKNVFLAGIRDTTLEINGTINTSGDIKLMADNGVKFDNGSPTDITGNNLIIYGGKGDIGSSESPIGLDINGSVDANSIGNIYLEQIPEGKDLIIQDVSSKGIVSLKGSGDIVMSTEAHKDNGYIRAGTLELNAGGSIGKEDDGLRILNNGAEITAHAGDGIYLAGKQDGEMVLKQVESTNGDIVAISEKGNITAEETSGKNVMLMATDGDVTAYQVKAKADAEVEGKNIILNNLEAATATINAVRNISMSTEEGWNDGSIGAGTLELNAGGSIGKAADQLRITNNGGEATVAADGDIFLKGQGEGELTLRKVESSNGEINVRSDGTVAVGEKLAAANGRLAVAADGEVKTAAGAAPVLTARGDVDVLGAKGVILNNAEVTSDKGSAVLGAASGDVIVRKLSAENGLAGLGSGKGDVKVDEIAGEDVILYSEGANSIAQAEDIVGSRVVVQAAGVNLGNIRSLRPGTATELDIAGGASGMVYLNSDSDLIVSNLNVGDAYIRVADGKVLEIDNLNVGGTAHIEAEGTTTTIYGRKAPDINPTANGAHYFGGNGTGGGHKYDFSELFNTPGNPVDSIVREEKLSQFIKTADEKITEGMQQYSQGGVGGGTGIKFYSNGLRHQVSNGILLSVIDDYRVDGQRLPLDAVSNWDLMEANAFRVFNGAYVPTVVWYYRDSLYDLDRTAQNLFGEEDEEKPLSFQRGSDGSVRASEQVRK